MAKKYIYAIKDIKIEDFVQLFFGDKDAQAIHAFKTAANQKQQNQIQIAPADFELWKLGEINTTTGQGKSEITYLTKAIEQINKKQ